MADIVPILPTFPIRTGAESGRGRDIGGHGAGRADAQAADRLGHSQPPTVGESGLSLCLALSQSAIGVTIAYFVCGSSFPGVDTLGMGSRGALCRRAKCRTPRRPCRLASPRGAPGAHLLVPGQRTHAVPLPGARAAGPRRPGAHILPSLLSPRPAELPAGVLPQHDGRQRGGFPDSPAGSVGRPVAPPDRDEFPSRSPR
jgi:hypothetical protein